MAETMQPMPTDWDRALCVAAHPDDLEYGAAGAVATWTAAGREVTYLLVTRGEAGIDGLTPQECAPLREAEQRAGAAVVGVRNVEFLTHRDGVLAEGLELRRDIAGAIRRHRPDLVVTLNHHERWEHGGWNSADHRAVGRSALDAVADAGNRWIFPELVDDGLLPWRGVRWVAVAGSLHPTHAVDVGDTFDDAVASLAAHASYLRALDPDAEPAVAARSFLEQATRAGAERFGGRPAVLFELI